ncbi:MAG: prolyl oligopeptidase family serine peptidase, partial [Planctomycetota bacterium]
MADDAGTPPDASGFRAGYPETRRVDHVDTYHGAKVEDPYRWLEADVRESPEVAAWVAEQQAFTRAYLDALPTRPEFVERLTALWNYERFGVPEKAGKRYLYTKNDGLQDQAVLYISEAPASGGDVLIDPNEWSEDGAAALSGYLASKDGRWLAYQRSEAGSDWRTIHVLDLTTGKDQGDELRWVKFTGIEWTKDNAGFYYNRYPEPEEDEQFQSLALNQKVYYHKLGTPQSEDRLIYEDPEHADWTASVELTDDQQYLVLTVERGTDAKNRLYFRPAAHADASWTPLIDDFDNHFYLIGSVGDRLLLFTDYQAPTKRVVAMPLSGRGGKSGREALEEIIPATDAAIRGVTLVGGKFFVHRLEDVAARVQVFSLTGKPLGDVPLPGVGSVYGFDGEPDDDETFFVYTSYDTPASIYQYDVATGVSTRLRQPAVPFNPDDYVVRREFYDSLDGTRVPIFVTHRKDLRRDHRNPTLLYGYGGFNISLTPGYSPSRIAWVEAGGVLAVANLRGGGEYGEEWHLAGKLHNKQNVFDDFIAAAEWLVATGYTSPDRLAIQGGSNGGLLVGAVMTQRPELFGACLPAVGVMDMLRFHNFTAGQFWRDEYGSSENADDFPVLRAYSPYHNLKPG